MQEPKTNALAKRTQSGLGDDPASRLAEKRGNPDDKKGLGLFALEDESYRLVLRPYDAHQHCAIRGKSVAFNSNRARLRVRVGHFQDVVIPLGLGLELFSRVNRGIVLAIGKVAIEESVTGSFILETPRYGDVTIPLVDCHGPGLNDGLAGEIALGGHQSPDAVQCDVFVREGGDGEHESN